MIVMVGCNRTERSEGAAQQRVAALESRLSKLEGKLARQSEARASDDRSKTATSLSSGDAPLWYCGSLTCWRDRAWCDKANPNDASCHEQRIAFCTIDRIKEHQGRAYGCSPNMKQCEIVNDVVKKTALCFGVE